MTTTTDVPTSPKRSGELPLLLPIASVIAAGVLVAYWTKTRTFTGFLTATLFSLTIVLDLVVLHQRRQTTRVSRKLGVYELLKAGLLSAFVFGEPYLSKWHFAAKAFSCLALLVALGVTLGLVATARALIRAKKPAVNTGLWELLTDKVLALTGLVVAFLHITYALTFALAFSDRYIGGQLYAVQLSPGGDPKTTSAPPPDRAGAPVCPLSDTKRVQKFFFNQSAATLPCTLGFRAAASRRPSLRSAICSGGIDARVEAFRTVSDSECDQAPDAPALRRAAAWNLRELYELRARFRQLACDGERSYLVEIRGHANDTRLKSDPVLAYGSNYEISKQRADQIELLLNDLARDAAGGVAAPAIRWLPYGVSSESSFLDPNSGDWIDAKLDKKLSVEVSVQEVADSFEDRHLRDARTTKRDLELIDYLYFTVYTITTTGYGDIIPTSSYAKFIVTLANLIELLFFVVLVNVIANTKAGAAATADEPFQGDDHADHA